MSEPPRPAAPTPTLWRIVATRLAVTALAVSAALIVFFFVKYMLDTSALRRATLEAQSVAITRAIRASANPAARDLYRDYPTSYGFRVFDHRRATDRHVVSEANGALLPQEASEAEADLSEGFFDLGVASAGAARRRWLLIDRDEVGGRLLWVQVVMVGDPASLWSGVIVSELFDHVFVPVVSIVPLLTIAGLLSVRQALRPLSRLARQAEAMGQAARRGQKLQALPMGELPLEFRELVGALNTMLAALGRVLAEQREFAADAAHELRTPLAVMALQMAELPPGPATAQLVRELQGLGRLVGQLLRFAQAENAMLSAQGTADLCAIGRSVCEDAAQAAAAEQREIAFQAADPPVLVQGNAELIAIALRNLVDNALGVSPAGGVVGVTVTGDGTMQVDDAGPGIPDASKEMIFERFRRGEWRGDRRGAASAGIGLALVRKIMDLHGGTAFVRDRAGGGSCFVLDFFPSSAPQCQSDVSGGVQKGATARSVRQNSEENSR